MTGKENQSQYAVVIEDTGGGNYIEFYWADDLAHALEQASNAHPEDAIGAVAQVPTWAYRIEVK